MRDSITLLTHYTTAAQNNDRALLLPENIGGQAGPGGVSWRRNSEDGRDVDGWLLAMTSNPSATLAHATAAGGR